MKFFHSIRWRLQLWHGLLLVMVLAGVTSIREVILFPHLRPEAEK